MRDPVIAEVWSRTRGSDRMYMIGTLTFDEDGEGEDLLTYEEATRTLHEFVDAVNEIVTEMRDETDG